MTMTQTTLETELLKRLEERDERQSACFEELALLFACQQDRVSLNTCFPILVTWPRFGSPSEIFYNKVSGLVLRSGDLCHQLI